MYIYLENDAELVFVLRWKYDGELTVTLNSDIVITCDSVEIAKHLYNYVAKCIIGKPDIRFVGVSKNGTIKRSGNFVVNFI